MAAKIKCGIKVPFTKVSEVREFDVPKRNLLRTALELGKDRVTFSNLPFHSLSPADAASLQLKWNITIGHDSIEVRVVSGSSKVQGMVVCCNLQFKYPNNPLPKSPGMPFLSGFPVLKKGQKSCCFTWEKEWLDLRWSDYLDGSIRVTLTVELISAIEVLNPEGVSIAAQRMPLPVLPPVNTFESYFLSDFLSDFSISSGGEVWPAHKMALAAGSKVFKRMFQSEMKEVKEGRINIPEVDPKAVKQMMTYLYNGCCEFDSDSDILFDLFKLADMYDIEGLRGQTLSEIGSIITVENAPEIYNFAELCGDNCLMEKALLVAKSDRKGFSKNPDRLKELVNTFPTFTFKVLNDA